MNETAKEIKIDLDELFKNGVHFGFNKTRRHPSAGDYIFGSKNKTDIIDLEKANQKLKEALEFVSKLGKENSLLLMVGGKNEAREAIKEAAEGMNLPYVAGRWIGGTLTNFSEIRKRIDKMLSLVSDREKGELAKYTKKERLLIDREIAKLQNFFSGLVSLTQLPKAVFVVDARYESTAVKEARKMKIPVIALCGTDNNMKEVDYPVIGNDSARTSIKHIVNLVKKAYGSHNRAS